MDGVKLTPSEIGSRTELEVALALVRSGRAVFMPLVGAHGRVDLVYDEPGAGLVRAQCKTGRVYRGALTFRVCSNTSQSPRDYRGEVDVFAVYAEQLREVFLVPVSDVATRLCHLRLERPRNNQDRRIRWAHQYLLHQPNRWRGEEGSPVRSPD